MAPREQKIAFRAMREMGVRGILIYYSNYKPWVWPFARQKYFRFFAEWQPSGRIRWVARPLDQTDVATCKRAPRPLPAVPNCRHNDDASVNCGLALLATICSISAIRKKVRPAILILAILPV